MSTSHLLPLHYRVTFVKGQEGFDGDSQPSTSDDRNKLNGDDVVNFYQQVLAESEVSKVKQHSYEPEIHPETRAPKSTMKKEIKQEPLTSKNNDSDIEIIEALTERDERLFLKAAAENDIRTVIKYRKKGINLEVTDMFGWTALMCASAAGAEDVVEFLVNVGVRIDRADRSGKTAVELAKANKHHNIAAYLESIELEDELIDLEPIDETFCEVCNITHQDSSHKSTIVHIVNAQKKPAEAHAYGISEWNPGYQLLKKSGWTESKGLGREGEGRKYPVKTVLKRDRKGLGLEKKLIKRVTHFAPYDPKAVENVSRPKRRAYFKELAAKQKKERHKEIKFRRMLNE